jgi:hypothetical protein
MDGLILVVVFVVPLVLGESTTKPERPVQDNVITSQRNPKVRVRLPESAKYVGADRWVLYDIADCELHAFVDADAQKNVQRLYWVQFEGSVPSRTDLHHTRTLRLGMQRSVVGTSTRIAGFGQRPRKHGLARTSSTS